MSSQICLFFPFLWNIYWKYVVYHGNNLAWHYTTKADNNSSWYKQVRYKVCVFFFPSFFLSIFDSQIKRKKSILFGTINLLNEKRKEKKKSNLPLGSIMLNFSSFFLLFFNIFFLVLHVQLHTKTPTTYTLSFSNP